MLPRWFCSVAQLGCSIASSTPPTAQRNRADELAELFRASGLLCLPSDDVRSSFVALLALGSWLTVVIDVKCGHPAGQTLGQAHAANPAHLLPILPVASNFDADGMSPASPRCKYRACRASLLACRVNPPHGGSNMSDSCIHLPAQAPPCRSIAAPQAVLKPRPARQVG